MGLVVHNGLFYVYTNFESILLMAFCVGQTTDLDLQLRLLSKA